MHNEPEAFVPRQVFLQTNSSSRSRVAWDELWSAKTNDHGPIIKTSHC
jgi:hypothetical protein